MRLCLNLRNLRSAGQPIVARVDLANMGGEGADGARRVPKSGAKGVPARRAGHLVGAGVRVLFDSWRERRRRLPKLEVVVGAVAVPEQWVVRRWCAEEWGPAGPTPY